MQAHHHHCGALAPASTSAGGKSALLRPLSGLARSPSASTWPLRIASSFSSSCSSGSGEEGPSCSGRQKEKAGKGLRRHTAGFLHSQQQQGEVCVEQCNSSTDGDGTEQGSGVWAALDFARARASLPLLLSLLSLASSLLSPGLAHASGGAALTGGALELFRNFLTGVEGLGPWGPVVFLLAVTVCEMVPLFPTQPLSLASGLLFGAVNGAALMLMGVTLAALNAFFIARGVGRPLAQKVIDWEMGHGNKEGQEEAGGGGMASKLSEVQRTIENGGLWQQITAITLLRLTPVVPFSASNYLLGLTPVQIPAFFVGTVGGMTVWSVLYASLGGASRKLLDNGADIGSLLTDLGNRASNMSASVAGYSVVAIGGVAAAYYIRSVMVQKNNDETPPPSSMPLANAEAVGNSSSGSPSSSSQSFTSTSQQQGESSSSGDARLSQQQKDQLQNK